MLLLVHRFPPIFRTLLVLTMSAAGSRADESLISVESLRSVPPATLASGREVRLSGVATYLRDTADDFNLILDDGSGGVMVYPAQRLKLVLGQRATVRGRTRLDRPFLRIEATAVSAGEMGAMPAPLSTTLAELNAGHFEGRYVRLEEMVRVVRLESADLKPRRLALDFGPRASRLTAWVSHYEGAESRFAPGVRVAATGVCVRWRNDRAQPVSTALLINSPADVRELLRAAQPPEPLADLLLWTGIDEPPALRTTSGTLTFCDSGELFVLQEGGRGLRVRPAPPDALGAGNKSGTFAPGTRMQASGFPALGEFTSELEDAGLRPIGPGEVPLAEGFRDAEALLATAGLVDRDARLVSLPATVREVRFHDARPAIDLVSAKHLFTAWLPSGNPLPDRVRAGSEIRVTGICTLHLSPQRRRLGRHPGDFSLLLRGIR